MREKNEVEECGNSKSDTWRALEKEKKILSAPAFSLYNKCENHEPKGPWMNPFGYLSLIR